MGYFKNTLHGVSWSAAQRVTIRGVSVLRVAVLARLLSPAEFGIFGIATITLALLEVFLETGVNVFLIQEKSDIKKYIDSAWVASIGRGIIMSLLLIGFAPFVASFFKSPESLGVLILIGFVPLLRGFINPSIIYFQRDIKFHKEFWYRTSLFLIDTVVTIILVFLTHSVYGLLIGMLASIFSEIVISFFFASPRPKLNFNVEYIKLILHRGKWVTLFGIFGYLAQEGDTIAVGRMTNIASLGQYNMAYTIAILPIEASDVVNQVVFPVYTKIAHDRTRLFRAFFRTTVLLTAGISLVSVFIYCFTTPLVSIFLGAKWVVIIPVLRLLIIYGTLQAIFGSVSSIFLAIEKQKYLTILSLVKVLGLGFTIIPSILIFGTIGAAYSVILSVLVEIPLFIYFTGKVFMSDLKHD